MTNKFLTRLLLAWLGDFVAGIFELACLAPVLLADSVAQHGVCNWVAGPIKAAAATQERIERWTSVSEACFAAACFHTSPQNRLLLAEWGTLLAQVLQEENLELTELTCSVPDYSEHLPRAGGLLKDQMECAGDDISTLIGHLQEANFPT